MFPLSRARPSARGHSFDTRIIQRIAAQATHPPADGHRWRRGVGRLRVTATLNPARSRATPRGREERGGTSWHRPVQSKSYSVVRMRECVFRVVDGEALPPFPRLPRVSRRRESPGIYAT